VYAVNTHFSLPKFEDWPTVRNKVNVRCTNSHAAVSNFRFSRKAGELQGLSETNIMDTNAINVFGT